MSPLVLFTITIFLFLAVLVILFVWRKPNPVTFPPVETPASKEEVGARAARQHDIEQHGTELIDRRVELDARRGALGGDTQIYDDFIALEKRLQSGAISEKEFEREKVRLLGG